MPVHTNNIQYPLRAQYSRTLCAQGIAPFGRDIAVLAPPAVEDGDAKQEAAIRDQPAAAGPEVGLPQLHTVHELQISLVRSCACFGRR